MSIGIGKYKFIALLSPYCKYAAATLESDPLVKDGRQVRVVFRHFPLRNHEWEQDAALAAACAEFQNQKSFWALHDALFAEQELIAAGDPSSKIRSLAAKIPSLNQANFRACLDRQMSLGAILHDKELGLRIGLNGTPSIFVNGKLISGALDSKVLHEELIESIKLARSHSRAFPDLDTPRGHP